MTFSCYPSDCTDATHERRPTWVAAAAAVLFASTALSAAAGGVPAIRFQDVTAEAGLDYTHGYLDGPTTDIRKATGGVAVGDVDGDGWLDLYAVRGDIGANVLLRNRGPDAEGTVRFVDDAVAAGVALDGTLSSGPMFFDADGDGWLDLFVGGIEGTLPRLFRNRGDGTGHFDDVTATAGITAVGNTVSATHGDLDRDGDLDVFLTHWNQANSTDRVHIWRNRGDGTFEPVRDDKAGIVGYEVFDYTLAPNIVDLDGDGWPDLAITGDFGTSKVFRNLGHQADGGLRFEDVTTHTISDENGMGAAFDDVDGDGDLDWFVSSIWDPDGHSQGHWGITGNRLYANRGDATFDDITDAAGVRIGWWGWAACFVDVDLDGRRDLFHTNGFLGPTAIEFHDDPSRLFLAQGGGAYVERSVELGLVDREQGRGAVCFDYDRDGDIDILVANNSGPPRLFRNDDATRGQDHHWISIRLRNPGTLNPDAIGAHIEIEAGGRRQTAAVFGRCSYVSQQPLERHFGLAGADRVDRVRVTWPDGQIDTWDDLAVDRGWTLTPRGTAAIPALGRWGAFALALVLAAAALRRLH